MMFDMWCRITTEFVVVRCLGGAEDLFRSEMSFQMDPPELTLQGRDLAYEFSDCNAGRALLCKEFIETAFSRDDLVTDTTSSSLHLLKNPTYCGVLCRGQSELIHELEHVSRSRVVVQLGGFGERHPAPCPVCFDLLRRECLDHSMFLTHVW